MRIGVLGSMVWDLIDHPAAGRTERWGGIAYSLAAAAAAAPPGWSIRPIIRIGSDLADRAGAFLCELPGLELPGGVLETSAPNNRVHLRYYDAEHRHECLSGGVPPWTWDELEPRIQGLDGLFVNLISGFELELETAERLRAGFRGLLYADLHSLVLDVADDGHRTPRRLPDRDRWLACFDIIQMNERELELVAGEDAAGGFPRAAVEAGVAAVLVTRGPAGARWVARSRGPRPWEQPRERGGAWEPEQADVALEAGARAGDPTGCGDVWGATCFVELMKGSALDAAVRAANAAARRNLDHRGAEGLHLHLTEAA